MIRVYGRTNKGLLALIIIIIIIIAAGVYLYYAQSSNRNVQTGMNNSTNQSMGNNSANTTSAATTISIQNMTFNPNQITIKSGTNIQWINNDNVQHQISSDNGAFQSNTLNPGDSYNFFFAKTGIYGYHDALNPTITGTIIVQ
ncbi:cupredoxin domain-containing protein [Methanobacterium sp.]|jgi:plastocyanin|uniref:cupredoxin domain-containing protein n=1 Tax=Methanobacterium sp. TaxID=2164 RepID=UPI0031580ED3